jgi:malate dehydrogenase (oxaloacetate-decarboxylating)(NADP+)
MNDALKRNALSYHAFPSSGKIEVVPSKSLSTREELALAYTPGVAHVCEAIAADPDQAFNLTTRSHLVAVITNGTAVLGLGDIGPLASKPVMEGKAVLFKKFADLDVFDIEINEKNPQKLIEIIASLEPTFGGINLEDIKAPDCFDVEDRLKERLKIPVFHDDQHGTAIIVAAALKNALKLVEKDLKEIRLVTSGAGAAAIACLDLLVGMGLPLSHITVTDKEGLFHEDRKGLHKRQARYIQKTEYKTLKEALKGADVFLGLSAGNILSADDIIAMAKSPIIFALANPNPEISPILVGECRPDAIMATGRSDYPNQVNNVLCFPFLFRGAMDVQASEINLPMKIACVEALSRLAFAESSDIVSAAYNNEDFVFGPQYLIPKPFDPRLLMEIAPAVAEAAMKSQVARKPIEDLKGYKKSLAEKVYRSSFVMRSVFDHAGRDPKRLVYAEGENERVLRAVQQVVDQKLALPILIGRPEVVEKRIERFGLRLKMGQDFDLVNPYFDPRYNEYCDLYYKLMARKGVTPAMAATVVRTNATVIAALMVKRGEADALLCGIEGHYKDQLIVLENILGLQAGVTIPAAMTVLMTKNKTIFITDTHVSANPTAEHIMETTHLAAKAVKKFGVAPKIALLSHSNFGADPSESSLKMKKAFNLIQEKGLSLDIDGEMQADTALSKDVRHMIYPDSLLKGQANLLVMPNLDAAHITLNTAKVLAEGLTIGPILLGMNGSAHILTPSSSVRGITNMSALAVIDAQSLAEGLNTHDA